MAVQPDRRSVLLGACAVLAFPARSLAAPADIYASSPFRGLSERQWKARIRDLKAFAVLRHEATEQPRTSPLLGEHRKGTFVCRGCDLPLFRSDWKYDSHTGWPSFYDAIPGALGTKTDVSFLMERTEYHCARCLGHHGHIFEDGPAPTGLRYCSNGVALKFIRA